jgi:hypothetical protein
MTFEVEHTKSRSSNHEVCDIGPGVVNLVGLVSFVISPYRVCFKPSGYGSLLVEQLQSWRAKTLRIVVVDRGSFVPFWPSAVPLGHCGAQCDLMPQVVGFERPPHDHLVFASGGYGQRS